VSSSESLELDGVIERGELDMMVAGRKSIEPIAPYYWLSSNLNLITSERGLNQSQSQQGQGQLNDNDSVFKAKGLEYQLTC
jgi:hypothetical protein